MLKYSNKKKRKCLLKSDFKTAKSIKHVRYIAYNIYNNTHYGAKVSVYIEKFFT